MQNTWEVDGKVSQGFPGYQAFSAASEFRLGTRRAQPRQCPMDNIARLTLPARDYPLSRIRPFSTRLLAWQL